MQELINLAKSALKEGDEAKASAAVKDLRAQISHHNKLYYVDGAPVITDSEFDELFFLLRELEEEFGLDSSASPTEKLEDAVGNTGLETVKHSSFVGSLAKEKTVEGVKKFINGVGSPAVTVGHKLDGLTIVAEYNDGKLTMASTRGDGSVGEKVLHTVQTIANLPKLIVYKGRLKIRFEALIPTLEFERINMTCNYSNARNLVAGTLRQLDPEVARSRNLIAIVFDLVECDKNFSSSMEEMAFLKGLGFEVVEEVLFDNPDDAAEYCESFEEKHRASLPYKIDGLVVKVNDLKLRNKLGYRHHNPKWAIAFKFKSLDRTTTLRKVEWNVGRTGQVAPTGIFDTVNIEVGISRATLHNEDYIKAKDLHIGDTIVVARNNDVIPAIISCVSHNGGEACKAPVLCPSCGTPLVKVGANLFCPGKDCVPQQTGRILGWCSRGRADIDGMGEESVQALFDAGFLKTAADIYSLADFSDQIVLLPRWGVSKLKKLLSAIESSRKITFAKFLFGLSIPGLGESTSAKVAGAFKTPYELLEEVIKGGNIVERLVAIEDVGEITANSIVCFVKENEQFIRSLLKELNVISEEAPKGISLSGKTFVITGTLSKPRDYFKKLITSNGGRVSGSVSKKTDYLLAGEEAGGKLDDAKKLGVAIIAENELFELMA